MDLPTSVLKKMAVGAGLVGAASVAYYLSAAPIDPQTKAKPERIFEPVHTICVDDGCPACGMG